MQAIEGCPGQLRLECALVGNEEIEPQTAEAGFVVVGIDEGARAACLHQLSCMPTGSPPRSKRPRCRPEMHRPEGRPPIVSWLCRFRKFPGRTDSFSRSGIFWRPAQRGRAPLLEQRPI